MKFVFLSFLIVLNHTAGADVFDKVNGINVTVHQRNSEIKYSHDFTSAELGRSIRAEEIEPSFISKVFGAAATNRIYIDDKLVEFCGDSSAERNAETLATLISVLRNYDSWMTITFGLENMGQGTFCINDFGAKIWVTPGQMAFSNAMSEVTLDLSGTALHAAAVFEYAEAKTNKLSLGPASESLLRAGKLGIAKWRTNLGENRCVVNLGYEASTDSTLTAFMTIWDEEWAGGPACWTDR